jgi:hypothetical protein
LAATPTLLPLIFAFAVMAPILFLRMRKMKKGTKVDMRKTIAFSEILLGFSAFAVVSSFAIGVPSFYAIAYGAIFMAVAYGSYHYSNRVLDFWRTPDGSIYAKGGGMVLVFYFAALIARVAISSTVGGGQGGFSGSFQGSLSLSPAEASPDALLAAIIVDGLLMVGAGLLVGRNGRIASRFRAIMGGKETVRQLEE